MINPEHLKRIRSDIRSRIRYPEINQLLDDLVETYERHQLIKDPVCGSGNPRFGCGQVLHWDSPDWSIPEVVRGFPDPLVAIRCIDCGVTWCPKCARRHFAAGDEKDRLIDVLQSDPSEVRVPVVR